jgi:hypothetical protein
VILDEVAEFLADQNLAVPGTDLFRWSMPDQPDDCIALYEYGGDPPMRTHDAPSIAYEQPRVQIVVRGATASAGRQRIEGIYRTLAGIKNTALSGTKYLSVEPIQQPFLLRRDQNDRPTFAFNCQAVKGLS